MIAMGRGSVCGGKTERVRGREKQKEEREGEGEGEREKGCHIQY
jgi:hypothetical protein